MNLVTFTEQILNGKLHFLCRALPLSIFVIIESSISINIALVDNVNLVKCFLNVLYQPNLPFLAEGLIRGFIING